MSSCVSPVVLASGLDGFIPAQNVPALNTETTGKKVRLSTLCQFQKRENRPKAVFHV
jgi:hypothetical protein